MKTNNFSKSVNKISIFLVVPMVDDDDDYDNDDEDVLFNKF